MKLYHVWPEFSGDDVPDTARGHFPPSRQCGKGDASSGVGRSDFLNLRHVQYRPAVLLAFLRVVNRTPPLAVHVVSVLLWSSWPKVKRIAAGFVSDAGMENERLIVRDGFLENDNPREAVSVLLTFSTRDPAISVSTLYSSSLPIPAVARKSDGHVRPEFLLKGMGKYLSQQFGRVKVFSHNSVLLFCATLSVPTSTRGQFHFNLTEKYAN